MSDLNTSNINDIYKITTQSPIQVRKVSQLAELSLRVNKDNNKPTAYCISSNDEEVELNLDNAYIMVAYPDNRNDIPHNFKFSVNKIVDFCYTSSTVFNDIKKYVDDMISYTTYYILSNIPGCVWNDGFEDTLNTYIHYYWNNAPVGSNIKNLQKFWNPDNDR